MKNIYLFGILGLVCALVYGAVLGFDFQHAWDDNWMVMNPFTVAGFTETNLEMIFTRFYAAQYSPVNQIIYTFIFKYYGFDPAVYHIYLLILHFSNSCFVMLLIERLIVNRTTSKNARLIAVVTAMLFAVHPMQVESIAWIAASKIPLYTFFVLTAMLSYIHYVRAKNIIFYIGAILLFVMAVFSKEQCVVLPVSLLLIRLLLGFDSKESKLNFSLKRTALGLLPFFILSLCAGLWMYMNQNQEIISNWAGYPLWQRLTFSCYSVVEYLGKLIIPANLLYIYPFPMLPGQAMPAKYFIYPIIMFGLVVFLIFTLRRRHWPIIFGLLFFLINISLMIHIVAMSRFTIMADRYVYLGSVGIFFIAAWYAVPWLQAQWSKGRKWFLALPIIYMLCLGCYAHYRTYAWRNNATLKRELRELINPELLNKYKLKHHEVFQ